MAPTIGVNLRVTGHCNQGGRKYMEDMFSVAYQQTADELDLEYAYFGIFDGHGGHEAATFAKEHLMKAIVSQAAFWSDHDGEVLRAIKDGFIATHYAMWRNQEKWPKTASGLPSTSGTTASVAFIRKSNIYIGHVGDSCIVLGYQEPGSDKWKGRALTQDHKPETPGEYERIRTAGGQVLCKAGVPRVVWHRPRLLHQGPLTRSTHIDKIPFLAVARSLGDLWSYNPDLDTFIVSPEPDVLVHHIELGRDKCLIFGTDGLWNMLTPDQAVSIVEKAEFNNRNNDGQDQAWLNPSKCLVDGAISNWINSKLRADNTSAVTLLLDPLGPPHSHVIEQNTAARKPETSNTYFVPYHIESYKVNETPSKSANLTNGMAIYDWYPRKKVAEPLNRLYAHTTTLKTMEALFGEKIKVGTDTKNDIDICQGEHGVRSDEDTPPEETDVNKSVSDTRECLVSTPEPKISTEADKNEEDVSKAASISYASVLKSSHKTNTNVVGKEATEVQIVKDLSLIQLNAVTEEGEKQEVFWVKKPRDSILTSPILTKDEKEQETECGMKLRGSFSEKPKDDMIPPKNYQNEPLLTNPIRRNGRRGKKRKNGEKQDNENSTNISLRSKRRHSSLVETVSFIYQPGLKRRSRSEDQMTHYDEGYKSDTENDATKLENKDEKAPKTKSKRETDKGETSELRFELRNNTEEYQPMRLRSSMSLVRTLRSRNINLETTSELGSMDKIHPPNRKMNQPKNVNSGKITNEDSFGENVGPRTSFGKFSNSLPKSTLLIITKNGRSYEPQRTVHTRSQNKKNKK